MAEVSSSNAGRWVLPDALRSAADTAEELLLRMRSEGSPVNRDLFLTHLEYVYSTHDWLVSNQVNTANFYSTVRDDGSRVWQPERVAVHEELFQHYLELWSDVPADRTALFSGGLPGAGKTTLLHDRMNGQPFAFLSPDELRGWLAGKGYLPHLDGFTPMEVSASAYHEVVYLTNVLQRKVTQLGLNAVYDTTLGYKAPSLEKIEGFLEAGYSVSAVFVDVDVDTALRRCETRHLTGFELWVDGVGEGGRLMPRSALLKQRSTRHGVLSEARTVFDELVHEGWFSSHQVYQNMVDGQHPVLSV